MKPLKVIQFATLLVSFLGAFVLIFITILSFATQAHADAGPSLKEDFEKTEAKLNSPELTEKQIASYAADARCLAHLPCFDVPVFVDKNDVYFEVKSSHNRDLCRQNVISSPEKVIVKTKCYRNDTYEIMNGISEFRAR